MRDTNRHSQLVLRTSKSGFPSRESDVPSREIPPSSASLIADRPARAIAPPAAKTPAPRSISPAHLKSARKAAKVFENFSLSKFAGATVPANYVDTRKKHTPKDIQDVQRKLVTEQLRKLADANTQNRGIVITFQVTQLEQIKKALPGMTERGGEVRLDDLLAYLRGRMNGTTFYSRGNPPLTRLTAAMQARSQARTIIGRVKNASRGKSGGSTS
jgi:hypothetical protein